MNAKGKNEWYFDVENELEGFYKHFNDVLQKEKEEVKACKKKTALEKKLARQMKLNENLKKRLDELAKRENQLKKICGNIELRPSISEGDKNRLEKAKLSYQVAKELTGIRFDLSAPPHIARGYVKVVPRKLLQSFELDMSQGVDSEALWTIIRQTATPGWPHT